MDNDDDEGERFFGDCFKERLSLVDTIVSILCVDLDLDLDLEEV